MQLYILHELVIKELRDLNQEEYFISPNGHTRDSERLRMKINKDLYKELLILKELLEEQFENYKD
jgi:hypothetical protein